MGDRCWAQLKLFVPEGGHGIDSFKTALKDSFCTVSKSDREEIAKIEHEGGVIVIDQDDANYGQVLGFCTEGNEARLDGLDYDWRRSPLVCDAAPLLVFRRNGCHTIARCEPDGPDPLLDASSYNQMTREANSESGLLRRVKEFLEGPPDPSYKVPDRTFHLYLG